MSLAMISCFYFVGNTENTPVQSPKELVICIYRVEFSRNKSSYLEAAFWNDGTVLWRDDVEESTNSRYLAGTISIENLETLISRINESGFLKSHIKSVATPGLGMTTIGVRSNGRWMLSEWDCKAMDPKKAGLAIDSFIDSWTFVYAESLLWARNASNPKEIEIGADYLYPVSKWTDAIRYGGELSYPSP